MPRGVYDRTKSKEQRAAEKKAAEKKGVKAAGAPKRKYTRRAVSAADVTKMSTKASGPDTVFYVLGEARCNIASLMLVAEKFSDLPSVKAEVDAHVVLLGQLREKLLSIDTSTASDEAHEEEEETAPAPQAAAIPNGVSAVTAAQTSVPLPPSVPMPPPVIPTPH